jgi:hypothetical protein
LPGGVLLYITGGTFTAGAAALVNLSPMTSGPYAGLLVWQDKSDATTMDMGAVNLCALNGVVYARNAGLRFATVSVNLTVGGIVAESLQLDTIGYLDIGP